MRRIFFLGLFISLFSNLFAQKINIGLLSGTNFSDIHGINQDYPNSRWKTKKGSVSGLFLSYSLSRFWELESEFNYTTLYFERVSNDVYWSDFSFNSMYPNPNEQEVEFNFYRIPIYLKFSIPTKLKFELSIGAYFSFLENYESASWNADPDLPTKDWGYFYSAGFSYDINNVSLFLNGRYITGRRNYEMVGDSKLASYELIMGVGYSGLFQKKIKQKEYKIKYDTINNKLFFKYKVGINNSWIKTKQHDENYSNKSFFSGGVSLKYKFDKSISIITELLYERKGYSYKDSSSLNLGFYNTGTFSIVDTKLDIDYIKIPILFNKDFGNVYNFYISTGPYFGFVLDAKNSGETWREYSVSGYYELVKTRIYENIENDILKNDWGWVFNTGIQFPVFEKYKLDLEIRYNLGIKNIMNKSDNEELNDDYLKNRSLGIYIGFQIPFI